MSFRVKLGIASALSIAMVVGILFLLLGERHPSTEEEQGAPDPEVAAAPKAAPAKKELPRPEAARPGTKRPAKAEEVLATAPLTGGWLITGRIVRESPQPEGGAADPAASVPAEGVAVILKSHPRRTKPGEALPTVTRTTGPDGKFEFVHVPGNRYMRMEIDEPSSALRTISFQLADPPADDRKDLGDIPIEPANTMVIKLEGPDGETVKKGYVLVGRRFAAQTSLQAQGFNESRREAEEQPGGKYVLRRAPPGSFNVAGRAPGYALKSTPCELPQKEPLVLRLEKGLSISGLVLTADRTPIEGAELEVSGSNLGDPPPKAKSDGSGRFYFDTLSAGEYGVKVDAGGYASARKDRVPSGSEDLEFLLAPEAVVSGKVIADDDESPIAKARVTIRTADRRSSFQKETDDKGTFEIRKLPAGSLLVLVEHEDFASTPESPLEVEEAARITDQVIRMKKGVVGAGKVVEAGTSNGIPDAQINLQPQGGGGRAKTARSGPDGAFEIKGLAEGRYFFAATAKGYIALRQRMITVTAAGAPDLSIELERGASIAGRITTLTGEPISGATVRPNFSSSATNGWDERLNSVISVSTQTDAEGRYRLEGLMAHSGYLVMASHRDYATGKVSGISLKAMETLEDIDISLSRGGVARGRVTDPEGKGIPGASISASLMNVNGRGDEDRPMVNYGDQNTNVATDSEGRYSLPHLPGGTYTIIAQARDRASSRKNDILVAEERATEGVDFVLGDGEVLAGRVVDPEGNPVASASVYIYGEDQSSSPISTDSEGHFQAKGFKAGQVSVQASKSGFIGENKQMQVPATDVVITLKRAAKIIGTVRAKGRDTFQPFNIRAIRKTANEMSSSYGNQQGDPSGRFEIEVGEGTYTLEVMVQGFAPSESASIIVKAGETVDGVVIDLVLGGTVQGVVVARGSGAPIEGANVNYQRTQWYGNQSTATTDAEGAFVLEGVPEGTVDLTATHARFAQGFARGIAIRAGGVFEARIEMGLGGGIQGTVSYAGRPAPGARVFAMKKSNGPMDGVYKNATTDSEGRFEIPGLPEGEYTVNANRNGGGGGSGTMRRDATVVDGQTAQVDLSEDAGIRVSGRVTSNGEPIRVQRIEIMQPERGWQGRSSEIDDSGNYSVEVPGPGIYYVMIQTDGRNGAKLTIEVPDGVTELTRDLALPSGEIPGVAVDAGTGSPIPNAQVFALASGAVFRSVMNLFRSMQGMARTDDQGRFVVPRLPGGSYSLLVMADGYATARLEGVEVQEGRRAREVRVGLDRGIDFQVRVTDQKGNPVPQAMAFLRDQDGNFIIFNNPWTSDQDGVVQFQAVLPGTYQLSTVHQSFAPARASLRAAAGAALQTVVLRPGGRLRAMVVNRQGQPVEGATVEVVDEGGENVLDDMAFNAIRGMQGTLTGKDGSLSLDQLGAGSYRISAQKGKARSKEEKFSIAEGQATEAQVQLGE